MRCPFCRNDRDRVVDSRTPGDAYVIRRRRECLECQKRFTTYERVEQEPLRVVKKDHSRIPFDRTKVLEGLTRACWKRPVRQSQLLDLVSRLESEAHELPEGEIPSQWIGEWIMNALKELDEVAYIRFASVYREFKEASDFVAEARPMIRPTGRKAGSR